MALPPLNLVVQSGPNLGEAFQVSNRPQIIGRGSGSNIVIADKSLSRNHARIQATPEDYIIEDLGSTNGTFINERRVSGPTPLRPGDTLRLGTSVTVKVEFAPGSPDDQDTIRATPIRTSGPAATAPATPVAQPQQSNAFTGWLWIMGAIILALAIIVGTMFYLRLSSSRSAAPTEVAQPPTLTPTPTSPTPTSPIPTNTPAPDATATPQPIKVPGVAAADAPMKIPLLDAIYITPFCATQIEVEADQAIYLDWSHPLAPPDSEADYPREWIDAAYYDLTVDGRPVKDFSFYQDGNIVLHFWHDLGVLDPGSHFVRIQWYTNRQISNGLDINPVDGQPDQIGPGPVGEGFCEIIVAEPVAEATATSTSTPSPSPSPSLTPESSATSLPTPTIQLALPPAPLGTFQNFETQSTWTRGDQPYGEFIRSSSLVYSGSYAGQLSYNFPSPNNDYVVFLQNRPLVGRPNAISAWVYGDGSGHFLNVWIQDTAGQTWGMAFGRVDHTGWQQMIAYLDPGQPWPSGHVSGPNNGVIDYPITFQGLVLDDGSDSYSGQGLIYIDDLSSREGYTPVPPSPTPAPVPTAGPYVLAIGNQHRYEEPWGAPVGGDPCRAWENDSWDDEHPNFRGFNVELLFTNNSAVKVQDDWGENMRFFTASGQEVTACYYGYDGAGPPPDGTTSLTFFTVVSTGDYVQTMQLNLNGQFAQLCLDGRGGWSRC